MMNRELNYLWTHSEMEEERKNMSVRMEERWNE